MSYCAFGQLLIAPAPESLQQVVGANTQRTFKRRLTYCNYQSGCRTFAYARSIALGCRGPGTAHQDTFCQLTQPLSYPALLLCELAVASRMFQVFVPTLAAFG